MDSRRVAPAAGVAASLTFVALLVLPYLVVEDAGAVGGYYRAGAVTPWAAGLMALVAVVVFAAGREDRTDPDTAAGAAVGLGAVVFLVTVLWALTVPADVPLQLTTDDPLVGPLTTGTVLEYHRWGLSLAGLLPLGAAAWYARALRLL